MKLSTMLIHAQLKVNFKIHDILRNEAFVLTKELVSNALIIWNKLRLLLGDCECSMKRLVRDSWA